MNAISSVRQVAADPALVDAYFQKVRSFEHDRLRSLRRVAGVAWTVAIGASVVAMAASFAAADLAMRPMPDPIVLRVDSTTGQTDRIYDVRGGEMAASEAEARHWLWQFVLASESYSLPEAQRNFDTVMLMATPEVQKQHAERVRGSNPQSPQVVLGRNGQATLSWISTTFIGPNLAQVRYVQIERQGDIVLPRKNMVATVAYDFARGPIRGGAINVNPRGFLATTYHTDMETPQ